MYGCASSTVAPSFGEIRSIGNSGTAAAPLLFATISAVAWCRYRWPAKMIEKYFPSTIVTPATRPRSCSVDPCCVAPLTIGVP